MQVDQSVNFELRLACATLLRQFMSGRMTNDEYQDRLAELHNRYGFDAAVADFDLVVWHLYCDIRTHRMTDPGRRPPKPIRRRVARWIVFLRTMEPLGQGKPVCKTRIARRLMLAIVGSMVFGLVCSLLGFWMGWVASLLSLFVWPWIVGGITLDDRIFSNAFDEDLTNPCPFCSTDALAQAVRCPTYLAGTFAR